MRALDKFKSLVAPKLGDELEDIAPSKRKMAKSDGHGPFDLSSLVNGDDDSTLETAVVDDNDLQLDMTDIVKDSNSAPFTRPSAFKPIKTETKLDDSTAKAATIREKQSDNKQTVTDAAPHQTAEDILPEAPAQPVVSKASAPKKNKAVKNKPVVKSTESVEATLTADLPPMPKMESETRALEPQIDSFDAAPFGEASARSSVPPHTPREDSYSNPVGRARQLSAPRKTQSLTHIRSDLAQLNEDMSNGEQFYSQSLKRISNLIDYAYETEANLSALEHLEPENQNLKADLLEAKERLTQETVRAETQKAKADAYEARYLGARQSLEKSQLQLTKLEGLCESLHRAITEKDTDIAKLVNTVRTAKNTHAVDKKTQDQLNAKNLQLVSNLSIALSEKLELEKRAQDLATRLEATQIDRQNLEQMVAETRKAQRATEQVNLQLKTQLEQVLADVKIFKQQFDSTSQNREAEIGHLRTQVSDLQADIAVKAGVVTHAQEEMEDLREKADTAQRGRKNLMEHIELQKRDYGSLKKSLENSKDETRDISSALLRAQDEIEQLRSVNSLQSDKLKRYTALNASPVNRGSYYERSTTASKSLLGTPYIGEAAARESAPSALEAKMPSTLADALAATEKGIPVESSVEIAQQSFEENITLDPTALDSPEIERRSADRPFQSGLLNPAMIVSAEAQEPMHGTPMETETFDREYASIQALAPLGMPVEPAATAPEAQMPAEPAISEADAIESALLGLHDLDLLIGGTG